MTPNMLPAYAFFDLSRKRDLTSRVVVVRDAPRRPEATDHLVAISVRVWDPKRSPTGEVPFEEVRADLASLPARFPLLEKVLVDEGAEAGSLLPFARSRAALVAIVEGFTGTVEANIKLWSALAARLHARTISIPRHERLLAELKSLRQESFAFGSKWRVVDSSRKLHRDLSLALAGSVYAAGEPPALPDELGPSAHQDGRRIAASGWNDPAVYVTQSMPDGTMQTHALCDLEDIQPVDWSVPHW